MLRILFIIAALILAPAHALAGQAVWSGIAADIDNALQTAVASYADGKASDAMEKTADAYFGIFEGQKANMEIAVRRFISLKKASELEKGFSDLRKAMSEKAPLPDIKRKAAQLIVAVKEAAVRLDGKGVGLEQ